MDTADELTYRRALFFEHWRERLAFLQTLTSAERRHEAHVLTFAHLDALANHWARVLCSKHKTDRRRFAEFLLACSGRADVFARVSAPDLWQRAESGADGIPADVAAVVRTCAARSNVTGLEARLEGIRNITDDPTADELFAQDLRTVAGRQWPRGKEPMDMRAWVRRSELGEFAYVELRNAWIHEGRPGAKISGFDLRPGQPSYLTMRSVARPRIHFSLSFMVGVLEQCIASFESETARRSLDPLPPERD